MAQCGDTHELAILNIAKAAGYSDEDAVLIAWACGMTDRCDGMGFHTQVNALTCLWSNAGLYFHFLPGDKKDLICQVDSELSRRIMQNATNWSMPNCDAHLDYACGLGIALHVLQDKYFHQNWVGKFSRYNVLPAWYNNKFTPSLPIPYGHSPKGKAPDVATAMWYDPRTNQTINNIDRVESALFATSQVLGLDYTPPQVAEVFAKNNDYEARKEKLRNLAGMPDLRFSEIRADMWKKYGPQFKEAAKAQAQIVRNYLDNGFE